MTPVLGYWKIRGLAQPIRLLLVFHGIKYEEEDYECGPAPDYSRKSWFDKKFNLDLDFPNLPYYIDGDLKLTQFESILRYIAEENKMGGTTPKERATLAMINGAITDLRLSMCRVAYNSECETLKSTFVNDLPANLGLFEKYLERSYWISGNKLDYPDFNLYDLLDTLKAFVPGCLDNFPKLQKLVIEFEKQPIIASYMKSSRFMKFPYNNRSAHWGGDK